jgi:hypothetical protein
VAQIALACGACKAHEYGKKNGFFEHFEAENKRELVGL